MKFRSMLLAVVLFSCHVLVNATDRAIFNEAKEIDFAKCEKIRPADSRAACFKKLARAYSAADEVEADADKENSLLIEKMKRYLVKDFKDPESAQFSGLVLVRSSEDPPHHVLCGKVNAKNSYGGYVGQRQFVVMMFSENNFFVDMTPSHTIWSLSCEASEKNTVLVAR